MHLFSCYHSRFISPGISDFLLCRCMYPQYYIPTFKSRCVYTCPSAVLLIYYDICKGSVHGILYNNLTGVHTIPLQLCNSVFSVFIWPDLEHIGIKKYMNVASQIRIMCVKGQKIL